MLGTFKGRVSGEYILTRRKASTGEIVQEIGPFKNDITNIGLNRIGTASPGDLAYVGTGTTPASILDTAMGSFVAATNIGLGASYSRTTSSPYWTQQSTGWRFPPAGVSRNLTEVGIGWTVDSVAGLWSRALIVDGVGNPVTITVLGDEFLDITYILRYYPPLTDSVNVVNISGTDYTFTTRLADAASSPFVFLQANIATNITSLYAFGGPCALGPITGSLTGTTSFDALSNLNKQTYVNLSLQAVYSGVTSIGGGNVTGGITGITGQQASPSSVGCGFQTTVSPAIPKDNTKSLSLSMSFTWDRN